MTTQRRTLLLLGCMVLWLALVTGWRTRKNAEPGDALHAQGEAAQDGGQSPIVTAPSTTRSSSKSAVYE